MKAKLLPATILEAYSWELPDGSKRGTFRASPEEARYAYRSTPYRLKPLHDTIAPAMNRGNTDSAVMFVGFGKDNQRKVWNIYDLLRVVKETRLSQTGHYDMTIMYRKGVYIHETNGEQYTQDGVQLLFVNVPPVFRRRAVFRKNMMKLAEIICQQFSQDTIIIRLERNGTLQETIGVTA